MKIGYQGIKGSNSEKATKKIISKLNIKNYELIPSGTPMNAYEKLKNGEVDLIVVALENNIGGVVKETKEILEKNEHKIQFKITLEIEHHLYMNKAGDKENIAVIISHEQAIKQSIGKIKKYYPNVSLVKETSTSASAKKLSLKEYSEPENVAVLCNEEAGREYGLVMIRKNMQGNNINNTTFILVSKN